MSTGPQLVRPTEPTDRNWLPLIVAAVLVLAVAGVLVWVFSHGKSGSTVTPISAQPDPYASSLSISDLSMSESTSLSGGKQTYLDGHIANQGSRTVTAISVQVLFRDYAHEVAWNETQSLQLIRTREPYVDTEPVSAAPLKPGDQRDFRLIFDSVPDSWDGAYPDLRIVHVEAR